MIRNFALLLLAATAILLSPLNSQTVLAAAYDAAVLADNPTGYWRFEEVAGTQATDSSGNGLHGTYGAAVGLGSSGVSTIGGNAASFSNVAASGVDLPGTWGSGSSAITLEAWVNVAASTGDFQAVVSSANLDYAHFQLHNVGVTGPYTNAGFVGLTPLTAEPTGNWRHVVLVAESGNTRVYENGVQLASSSAAFASIVAGANVDIGRGYLGGRHLNGLIDEVAIYDSALTTAQIKNHFYAATDGGLVAHYTFDVDGSDSSFQGNHGTLGGGASITTDARIGGGALDLRTSSGAGNGFVDIVGPALRNLDQYTVSMFVNVDSASAGCCDALLTNDGFATGSTHINLNGGNLENAVAGTSPFAQSTDDVTTGEWVHVAFTYDATTGTTTPYIDGVAQPATSHTLDQLAGLGGITIGAWDSTGGGAYSRFFDGRIDDLRIYSRVLSADELSALSTGVVPEPASLLVWSGLAAVALLVRRRKRS